MCSVQKQQQREGSCALQMFSVPLQLLELQRSVSPGGQRAEAQKHKNRMEHEVTLKASEPRAPQTSGTCNNISQHKVWWRTTTKKTDKINYTVKSKGVLLNKQSRSNSWIEVLDYKKKAYPFKLCCFHLLFCSTCIWDIYSIWQSTADLHIL